MSEEIPSSSCSAAPEREEVVETAPLPPIEQQPTNNPPGFYMGPIMVGPEPMPTTCPHCHDKIVTNVQRKADTKTHLFALALCMAGLWPCCACLIPYRVGSCMSKTHFCPNCKAYLGSFSN